MRSAPRTPPQGTTPIQQLCFDEPASTLTAEDIRPSAAITPASVPPYGDWGGGGWNRSATPHPPRPASAYLDASLADDRIHKRWEARKSASMPLLVGHLLAVCGWCAAVPPAASLAHVLGGADRSATGTLVYAFVAAALLTLVDLAGSERNYETTQHDRTATRESADINMSLQTLKECFRATINKDVDLETVVEIDQESGPAQERKVDRNLLWVVDMDDAPVARQLSSAGRSAGPTAGAGADTDDGDFAADQLAEATKIAACSFG